MMQLIGKSEKITLVSPNKLGIFVGIGSESVLGNIVGWVWFNVEQSDEALLSHLQVKHKIFYHLKWK